MSTEFHRWLDATLRYVEALRDRGVRYVAANPELLAALARPLPAGASAGQGRPSGVAARPAPALPSAPAAPSALESRQAGPNRGAPTPLPKPAGSPWPALPGVAPSPLPPEAKAAAMQDLRARALACQRCPHLASSRQNVVFGIGDIHSPLVFVGEAPGSDEDQQGEPFVGRAGQLLTKIIETMGLTRSRVYIANILKCRPDTPGQSSGNRKPTADEMKTCLPYVQEQIELIRPQVIVALGATAVEGLFGRPMPITRLRGQWQDWRGTPVMPTYHPAYLLRNQALSEKRKVWEDMLQVMERLGMQISEKQRGYFLAAR